MLNFSSHLLRSFCIGVALFSAFTPSLFSEAQPFPKILLLFCGGTIVMEEKIEESDDALNDALNGALTVPSKEKAIASLLALEPRLKEIATIDLEYVANVDSTNLKPYVWEKLGEIIAQKYDLYDGFVITHGTDTMAYTASALTYSLQHIGKPVVLTGAQIPAAKIENDARRNLINSIRVASMDVAGVFIVFDDEIILGARSTKVSESSLGAFRSYQNKKLGEIQLGICLHEKSRKRHFNEWKLINGFESNICVIDLVPGLPPTLLSSLLQSNIKGFVIRGFGAGNIPSDCLHFLQEAKKKQIPVVVATQCYNGRTAMRLYEVGKQALDCGVIEAHDMTLESTVTKLMWALKQGFSGEKLAKMMSNNFADEVLPKY